MLKKAAIQLIGKHLGFRYTQYLNLAEWLRMKTPLVIGF